MAMGGNADSRSKRAKGHDGPTRETTSDDLRERHKQETVSVKIGVAENLALCLLEQPTNKSQRNDSTAMQYR